MLAGLPFYISLLFIITTLVTLWLFYNSLRQSSNHNIKNKSHIIIIGIIGWLLVQAVLAFSGVYANYPNALPPLLAAFGIIPLILLIVLLFINKKGKNFIDSLPLKTVIYWHAVRVPVEIVLFLLYKYQAVPELMTFEGRNFDIIAGLTALPVAFFAFRNGHINRPLLWGWNLVCIGLLFNIVFHGLLSAPSPLQRFAFDQPNIALLYFPFAWLPTFIVPMVLFGHLVAMRQLWKKTD